MHCKCDGTLRGPRSERRTRVQDLGWRGVGGGAGAGAGQEIHGESNGARGLRVRAAGSKSQSRRFESRGLGPGVVRIV